MDLLLHHLTLTVTNIEDSITWYQRLLGPANAFERRGAEFRRVRLTWMNGLILGFTEHATTTSTDRFDHTRVGMDHVALGCRSKDDVEAWAHAIDECGFRRGPIEEVFYGWAVTARDPDDMPLEFFCFNDEHLQDIGVVASSAV